MTKETLLKLDWFEDNEFLDQYLELVNNADAELPWPYQKHHCIPACYYAVRFKVKRKMVRLFADADTKQELVKFTLEQHLEAHRLLILCTTGELQTRLQFAYEAMTKLQKNPEELAQYFSERKKINSLAKELRKDSNYRISWEDCKIEAKKLIKNLD